MKSLDWHWMMSFRAVVGVLVGIVAIAMFSMQPADDTTFAKVDGKAVLICGGSAGIGQ